MSELPPLVAPLLSLAELVLPACVAAWWTRQTRGIDRVAVVLALAICLVAADLRAQILDLWDVVVVAASLVVGAGVAFLSRRVVWRTLIALLLFAVVAEAGARLALQPAPGLHESPTEDPLFRNATRLGELACAYMRPQPPSVADARPAVLHVGDSLLSFPLVAPELEVATRFPGMVGAHDPSRHHLSLSMPGSGYDAYLLAVRAQLAAQPVSEVVFYVYPGNDLSELGRAYPCCASRWLLDLSKPELPGQCEPWRSPPARLSIQALVLRSKAPLVVRWLQGASRVFSHLRYRAVVAQSFGTPWSSEIGAADDVLTDADAMGALELTGRILAELQRELIAQHVTVVLVILPYSDVLRSPDTQTARGAVARVQRIVELGTGLGLRVLDASSPFESAHYDRAMFAADEVHLSDAGHAAVAAWLTDRLLPPP